MFAQLHRCIAKYCLEPLSKFLHPVALARPRAGGLENILMSIEASPAAWLAAAG
jgi:hypothetical protein